MTATSFGRSGVLGTKCVARKAIVAATSIVIDFPPCGGFAKTKPPAREKPARFPPPQGGKSSEGLADDLGDVFGELVGVADPLELLFGKRFSRVIESLPAIEGASHARADLR